MAEAGAGAGDDRQEVKIVFKNVPYTIGGASNGASTRGASTRGASRGASTSASSYESQRTHERDQRRTPYEGNNIGERAYISLCRLGTKIGGQGVDAVPETPPTSNAPTEVARSSGLAFLATTILGALDQKLLTGTDTGRNTSTGYTLVLFMTGAMGVSITNIFNDPEGPYNQPVNVFFGHFISLIAGLIASQIPDSNSATLARNTLAIGLATLLMRAFKVYHPPATATASVVVAIDTQLHDYTWYYGHSYNRYVKIYFIRTIISTIIILGVALLSNLNKGFQYPRTWAWGGLDFGEGSKLTKRLGARAEAFMERLKERAEKKGKDLEAIAYSTSKGWVQKQIEALALHTYSSIVEGSFSLAEFGPFVRDDILDNVDNIKEYFTFEKIVGNNGAIGMIDRIKEMVF